MLLDYIKFISTFILLSLFDYCVFSQCTVDIGSNIVICVDRSSEVTNNVALNAQIQPNTGLYKVKWYIKEQVDKSIFDNDTILNPRIDSFKGLVGTRDIYIYVTVTDSSGSKCSDSLLAKLSFFAFLPDVTNKAIVKGDSIQIYSLVGGGIPPLEKKWMPDYNISSISNSNITVWPEHNTIYSCTTIDSAGCVSSWLDNWNILVDTTTNNLMTINSGHNIFSNFHNLITNTSEYFFQNTTREKLIRVYNMTGQVIYTHKHYNSIKIGDVVKTKGQYIMSVIYGDEQYNYKVVLN